MERINAVLRAEGRRAVESGRLQAVRESAHLSRRELAQALEVTPTAVTLWEAGKRTPRGDAAERLALLLGQLEDTVTPQKSASPGPDGPGSQQKADAGGPNDRE